MMTAAFLVLGAACLVLVCLLAAAWIARRQERRRADPRMVQIHPRTSYVPPTNTLAPHPTMPGVRWKRETTFGVNTAGPPMIRRTLHDLETGELPDFLRPKTIADVVRETRGDDATP